MDVLDLLDEELNKPNPFSNENGWGFETWEEARAPLIKHIRALIDIAKAARILVTFLDEEIGMDKTELTMVRHALKQLTQISRCGQLP